MKTCFKWDKNKAASNLRKHGVCFEAAAQVFEDPFAISIQDQVENGEERWKTIGMSGNCVQLLVAHNVCFECLEVIRIISARRAGSKDRKFYERGYLGARTFTTSHSKAKGRTKSAGKNA